MSTHPIPRIDLAPVFRRAAEIITTNGRYQGDYLPDPFNRVQAAPDHERPMSVVAALRCAETGNPRRYGPLSTAAIETLANRLLVDGELPFWRDEFMLECHVAAWGDVPGRTADEVVAELQCVAADLVQEWAEGRAAEQRHQFGDLAVPPLACRTSVPAPIRPAVAA